MRATTTSKRRAKTDVSNVSVSVNDLLGTMSRRRLAGLTKLHPSYICRILRLERRPSLDAAAAMAEALGLELGVFRTLLKALPGPEDKKRGRPPSTVKRSKDGP